MSFAVRPIAILRTPFAQKFGVPRQSGVVEEAEGRIEFLPEFARGDFLRGIDGFSHVWLVTWFHLSSEWTGSATVRPPRLGGDARVGVFASRSPNRPNPLGLSLVRVLAVETEPSLVLRVAGIDAVDGTPVLDIKPHLPWCETPPGARAEWADGSPIVRDDDAVHVPEVLRERILKVDTNGAATLALLRKLLRLNLQPAYQEEPGRVYGMEVAGWNVRWRFTADRAAVEVVEALQTT